MKQQILTVLTAITLAGVASTQAALITWDGTGDGTNWTDGNNWGSNSVPGVADTMEINNAVVDFNTTFSSTIANGSNVIKLLGTTQLNLTGGSLSFQAGATNTSPLAIASGAVLNISGGTHNLLGRYGVGQTGTTRVTGSQATINLHQSTAYSGTYDFVLDGTGVSKFNYGSWAALGGASLQVDGSSFDGSGSFELFNIGAHNSIDSTFNMANVVVSGFDAGTTWTLAQEDVGGRSLVTLVVVPEPGTYALIGGFLALGYVMVRRRR